MRDRGNFEGSAKSKSAVKVTYDLRVMHSVIQDYGYVDAKLSRSLDSCRRVLFLSSSAISVVGCYFVVERFFVEVFLILDSISTCVKISVKYIFVIGAQTHSRTRKLYSCSDRTTIEVAIFACGREYLPAATELLCHRIGR